MNTRITIKNIARELNVHHSTVSRALKNDPRVKKKTSDLIRNYAAAHGYQVNMSALILRGSIKNVLAVVVPDINHQFFSSIISQFTEIANTKDYVVSIFQTNESLDREKDIINTLIRNNVAGVIASISMETRECDHFLRLGEMNVPLVMFDRVLDINGVSQVQVNNSEIVTEAVNLLIKNGYNRIAHVSGTPNLSNFRRRQEGYIKAVQDNNLNYNRIYHVTKAFEMRRGTQAAKVLFNEKVKPDAIICDSDYLLMGIILQMKKAGLKIASDVGLIAFGNNPAMELITPCISTIVQPTRSIALTSFNVLNQKITGENRFKTENIFLKAKIIERESCKKSFIS